MSTAVKYYTSAMSGAPSLANTAGSLIGVLDACLVDGFGSVSVDSLVVASNVATVTVSAGHQFAMVGSTGPVIRIAGASPSGLNGDWRVTVTSTTAFTFATTGISDQTASGTITAKPAPAGFSKAFSDTNKAAYRSDDVTGTRLYLRIDDTPTTYARCRGFEAMTDVDTGTGLFPTDAQLSGGGYVYKSSSGTRSWTLYSDGRMVYFFCDATGSGMIGGLLFGDIRSYVTADAYGCALVCSISSSGTHQLYQNNSTAGSWIARGYAQTGGSSTQSRYSHAKCASTLGAGGETYPAVADNSVHIWPVEIWDGTANSRGLLPGFWCPVHGIISAYDGDLLENMADLPGRTARVQVTGGSYTAVIDIAGPWR